MSEAFERNGYEIEIKDKGLSVKYGNKFHWVQYGAFLNSNNQIENQQQIIDLQAEIIEKLKEWRENAIDHTKLQLSLPRFMFVDHHIKELEQKLKALE